MGEVLLETIAEKPEALEIALLKNINLGNDETIHKP
jgi:hypothetical protein